MLSEITPVILTYNEAANLDKTLSHLRWSQDIVIVDSGSTDDTAAIAQRFPQVRWFERPFDTFANQWRYAVFETGIETDWVLRLDADYVTPEPLVQEISQLDPGEDVAAYRIGFDYAIHGHLLRSSLYPPYTTLFKKEKISIHDRGHAEAWEVRGTIKELGKRLIHDDRKPLDRWLASQGRYMALEAERLRVAQPQDLRFSDRLRKLPLIMPLLTFAYCLFGKGLVLDGKAGYHYALQRLIAEAVLSLTILDQRLKVKSSRPDSLEV